MDEPDDVHPLAQAAIDAHATLAPKLAEAKKQHVTDLLHQLEADLSPLIGPLVQRVLDDPGASDELKGLLAEAATPGHQFGSLVVGFAIGSVVGPALGAALAPELQVVANNAWRLNPTIPIPVDVAVTAVLKNILGPHDPAGEAAMSGINGSRFAQMVQAAGSSLGLEESLLLERRGQWVGTDIDAALRYSLMNPTFYESAKNLKWAPLSVGEVVTANLKGHITDPEAAVRLNHAGIDPANQPLLKLAAGRPPGLQEMLHLWNATTAGLPGFATSQADVEASVRQSDINDTYMPQALQLRQYLPPPRSIVPMLRHNGVTETQARQLLTAYGVQEPWLSAFIAESKHSSSTTVKELSSSQVTRMYETRLIDRPTANARLTALNYSPADATLLLDFADDARHEQLLQATIRKVGTLYVAHKLSRVDAAAALNTAGVPVAAQHDLFTLWDIQRTATSHVPSPSMVVGAGRRQEITPAEVKTRLNQLGIANDDLAIFVADGWPPTHALEAQAAAHAVVAGLATWPAAAGGPPPTVRKLTVAQISQLFTAGTIGTAETIRDLEALGYSNTAAVQLVSTFTPPKVPKP